MSGFRDAVSFLLFQINCHAIHVRPPSFVHPIASGLRAARRAPNWFGTRMSTRGEWQCRHGYRGKSVQNTSFRPEVCGVEKLRSADIRLHSFSTVSHRQIRRPCANEIEKEK